MCGYKPTFVLVLFKIALNKFVNLYIMHNKFCLTLNNIFESSYNVKFLSVITSGWGSLFGKH